MADAGSRSKSRSADRSGSLIEVSAAESSLALRTSSLLLWARNMRISVYANWSIAQIVSVVKKTLSQRFGLCVRQLRLEAGLTQVEFGELCGFYQTYLSRLEQGQANPTLNAMEVIAGGLGLSIFELWDRVKRVS